MRNIKSIIKNEKGFTLIEMMIVLLVISVLLIIAVPNINKQNTNIKDKGCEALIQMIEAQVQSFEMEKGSGPANITELQTAGYLKENQTSCPNGDTISITSNGVEVSDAAVQ